MRGSREVNLVADAIPIDGNCAGMFVFPHPITDFIDDAGGGFTLNGDFGKLETGNALGVLFHDGEQHPLVRDF